MAQGSNLVNWFLSFAVSDDTMNAPVRSLHELQQRLLIQLPLIRELRGIRVFAAGELKRYFEAVRVDVVEVLHATGYIIPAVVEIIRRGKELNRPTVENIVSNLS